MKIILHQKLNDCSIPIDKMVKLSYSDKIEQLFIDDSHYSCIRNCNSQYVPDADLFEKKKIVVAQRGSFDEKSCEYRTGGQMFF